VLSAETVEGLRNFIENYQSTVGRFDYEKMNRKMRLAFWSLARDLLSAQAAGKGG
jgi:hypothetical protein